LFKLSGNSALNFFVVQAPEAGFTVKRTQT